VSQLNLTSFLLRCLGLTVALSVLWLLVATLYTGALAASVGLLLPQQLDVVSSGSVLDLLVPIPSDTGTRGLLTIDMETWGFGYGIVLTGALILSTPSRRVLSRLYWLAAAWTALFVAQIAVINLFGRMAYSSIIDGSDTGLFTASYWLMYGVWMMLPPLLWIAWAFRLLLPRPARA
jgi:hypothetical protein